MEVKVQLTFLLLDITVTKEMHVSLSASLQYTTGQWGLYL